MPLFVLTAMDKPKALETRLATREAHLAYLRERGVVRLAGPFLDAAGDPAGSLLIIEAADLDAARAFAAADPYAKAGLFQSVDIRAFKATIGEL